MQHFLRQMPFNCTCCPIEEQPGAGVAEDRRLQVITEGDPPIDFTQVEMLPAGLGFALWHTA